MKKYFYLIYIVIIGGFLFSCSDKLDVTPPNNLTDEQILKILASGDEDDIELVMNSLASDLDASFRLNGNFSGFSGNALNPLQNQDLFGNLRGNDIVMGESELGASGYYQSFYNIDSSFEPWRSTDRTFNYTWWKLAATPHINANKVLQYLDTETVGANNTLKDYRARCLTVRAYGYMMLMERYQKAYLHGGKDGKGMPIYTEYGINTPLAPASATDTYDFIKKDLKEAVNLFTESEIGEGADGYTMEITNDIDCAVAQFLLARVALWTGDNETCISSCDAILNKYPELIQESAYGVPTSSKRALAEGTQDAEALNNAFASLEKNPECILGWVDGNGAQTYQYSNFNCFGEGSGGLSSYFMRIDDRLYNKIAENDYRKTVFLDDTLTYVYPTDGISRLIPKYTNLKWAATISLQQLERNNQLNCDFCYYRSSEVLLMKAEAQANSSNETGAKETLNILLAARTKDGTPTLTCDNYPAMAGLSALDMVKLQWRIEMWGENGTEYSNSKRWNVNIDRTGSTTHWSSGKTYSVDHMTYEIPIEETSTNGNWNN
ncbi:Starch-binding associating with outer membrane [Mariniphaga anaerophila]|uniref:Starch-binding associating with outer membrane n=1 Tax=Mariniphaga anaerophila TaxID=1484053 RepID=A0A1M5G2B9_9BACT|nr:RagB/SusD family nutrient uptake outer membrane protein [Mariniphaga anaerophila]SHF97591.1 Starch-binding associating with outer membrane [Mariniphaga anaerophila]